MKKILILAGGFGTRLRSIVSDVPKPLAPVNGKPFLKYQLDNLILQGAKEIILLLHFEANKIEDMIKDMIQNQELDGVDIKIIIETNPLGTGGAILNAIKILNIEESFLVINADTWVGCGLKLLENNKTPAVAAVRSNNCKRYGSLKVNKEKILYFNEKSETGTIGWINAGMYHLSKDNFFDYKPSYSFSLEDKILPRLADLGELRATLLETEFIDIGIPDDYLRFCEWIKRGKEIEL